MASPLSTISSLLLPSLLLLCFFCCSHHVHGEVEEQGLRVLRVESLMPGSVCSSSSRAAPGRNSLTISHRRGPCSPLAGAAGKPSHRNTLRQDSLRVESLQTRLSKSSPQLQASLESVSLPAQRGSTFGTNNYIVTVGFGTPKKDQTVVFDTGSDVCWIQCKPCSAYCYPQQEPLFDPLASSSYRNVSCGSAACYRLDTRGCLGDTCLYRVLYGDNSSTVGFFAQDSLTLTSSKVITSFLFGCGQKNKGLFGRLSGLLGLGRSSLSLVSQASQTLGVDNKFSYCLPSSSSSTGHLTIGGSNNSSTAATYTRMLTDPRDGSLYFMNLTGISVGGKMLPISPAIFQSGGTIVDSGTVITRLPPAAYAVMRSAFKEAMSQYPAAPAFSLLDTCFDLSKEQTITYPVVGLQFDGGVNVELEAVGIFYVPDISQVCLAFAANSDAGEVGIVGNVQQRTMEVVYDIVGKRIGFAPGAC